MMIKMYRYFNIPMQFLLILGLIIEMTCMVAYASEEKTLTAFHENKPKHSIRVFVFVLRNLTIQDALKLIDTVHAARFNVVVAEIADAVALRSAPWTLYAKGWDRNTFVQFVEYVRGKGMKFVPYVSLLTHQEKFFQDRYPELMYNRVTYDPRNKDVYKFVYAVLDELIELTGATSFHIGHDEVVGWNENHAKMTLAPGERMLPSRLYYEDIVRIHTYLKKRNIETWMWGDMLISPEEFPNMLADHLHGGKSGYGRNIREKLPKDIIICDWHYFDEQEEFPTIDAFQAEGFRVIGVTWKRHETTRNFSAYAAQHGAYGMMGTPWFHIQRYDWTLVEEIIRVTGDAFWSDR